ncbi:MAG: hypothetical protein ACREQA_16965 [Candidatus Binatia bacterium]
MRFESGKEVRKIKSSKSLLSVMLLTAVLGLGLVGNVQAQEECSVATLQGDYLLTGGAQARIDQRDDPTFPRVTLGVHTFDGAGNLSGFNTMSHGGQILRNTVAAIYTLNSDCTGTITFPVINANWEIVVTRDGREGAYIRVDEGTIATRSIKK